MDRTKTNKIKVCFVQTNIYPFFDNAIRATTGGAELQLYLLGTELAKDDRYEVSYLVGNFGQPRKIRHGDITIYGDIPTTKLSLATKLVSSLRLLRVLREIDANIYLSSGANSVIGLLSFFCRIKNKFHIYRTSHKNGCNKKYILSNGLTGRFFQYGIEHANVLLTQSEEHQLLLKKFHNRDSIVFKNVFYIPAKKDYVKNSILWVARLAEWKQPELFMELAKSMPDSMFTMICSSTKENEVYQQKIISKIKQIPNITLLHQIPYKDIQQYFNSARVFVNTSKFEGFPNTFLQAGIARTPIVSLNVNPDDFITKNNCGIFCNGNVKEMTANTKDLVQNLVKWQEKSENVYTYVNKHHNISKQINLLKKIIEELATKTTDSQ